MSNESKIAKVENRISRWWGALLGLPVIGIVIKEIIGKMSEKSAENLTKRVAKALGMGTEGAKKSVTDEILYAMALYSPEAGLTPNEIKTLDEFEVWLRGEDLKELKEKGAKKAEAKKAGAEKAADEKTEEDETGERAEAYVLFVANILNELKKETKEIVNPKKGTSGPKTETVHPDYSVGFIQAGRFFKELLKRTTDEKKVEFLRGKNVFSLISRAKEPDPILEALKRLTGFSEETLRAGYKKANEEAKKLSEKLEKRFFELDACGKPKEDSRGRFIPKKKGGEAKLKSMIYKIIELALFLGAVAYIIYSL
jgi:hypothetical protein